ncbi:ATPase [Thioalkalivibrio denitrificans]|uniref:ATPase n=2 Tax=Thioalkalivibrio denitrificans TaxID=108003 RepID=A0A1V3N677_9GAMM|nr:ATPase [Thioalkalivibrio denitrificans]
MIERRLHGSVLEHLQQFPAVALLGPRQAGKTTLAEMIRADKPDSVYLDLESPADRAKLIDPESYLARFEDELVILDEVQRVPELFQPLRGLIDRARRRGVANGRFLLLGSASGDLLRQSGESLAGRIAYLELPPFQVSEIEQGLHDQLWVRGGFPDSFLASGDRQSQIWRRNLISTYLERDIPSYGTRVPAETLLRFWTMLAHNQAGLLNVSQLARNLMLDTKTVNRYLDLLSDLFLVRRLLPWHANVGKRLVKAPRTFIRDSGLVHALLSIGTLDDLLGHPVVGGSWEGFVVENLLNAAPFNTAAGFYRTGGGAEIDLVMEVPGAGLWAVEIKRGVEARPRRGFYRACEDLQPDKRFMVYPGSDRYSIGDGVEAIGLSLLVSDLLATAT